MKRKQLVLLAVCSIAFSGNFSVYASELTDGTDFETAEVVLAETEADILESGEEMAVSESAEGQKEEQLTQQKV